MKAETLLYLLDEITTSLPLAMLTGREVIDIILTARAALAGNPDPTPAEITRLVAAIAAASREIQAIR